MRGPQVIWTTEGEFEWCDAVGGYRLKRFRGSGKIISVHGMKFKDLDLSQLKSA